VSVASTHGQRFSNAYLSADILSRLPDFMGEVS
jgi:hypothetical protein